MIDPTVLRQLCEQATPGPWRVREHPAGLDHGCFVTAPDVNGFAYAAEILGEDEYREQSGGMKRRHADAQFIAAAREALPQLLDENAALRAALVKAVEHCPCTIAERDSGHRVDCYVPEVADLLRSDP